MFGSAFLWVRLAGRLSLSQDWTAHRPGADSFTGLAGVTGRFSSKKARTETHWASSGPTLPLEQIAVAREMKYAKWLSACQLQAKGRLKFPASEVSGKRMKRGFPERKSDCWNPNRGLQHDRSERADAHSLGFHGL